jgi:tetratricopeptide (TPR) repeat protein
VPAKQTTTGAATWLVYGLIMIGALTAVWSFNVDNVYADMRFQQGQNYTEGQQTGLDQYLIGSSFYLDALRMEPDQDFYYLNLGRSLMSIVDIQRQSTNQDLGQVRSNAKSFDLLQYQEPAELQQFVVSQPPMVLMSYAEAVLLDAQRLSPLNKDHFANLGRMYNFWYSRLQREPAILDKAVDWYRRGVEVAPQDVSILNEYAAIVAVKASEAQKRGDQATADQSFNLANELLLRSAKIDPRYRDTDSRIAEVLRLQGRYEEAVDRYLVILASNPRALDSQITAIIEALRSQPALLLKLRGAYEAAIATNPDDFASQALIGLMAARGNDLPRAAAAFNEVIRIQPNNLEARQNYTLVLSDMLQYRQAADQAAILLEQAKQQGANQDEQAALQGLLVFLEGKAAGQ